MRADESETAAPDPRPTPRRQATEPRVSARAVVLNAQGEILLVRHRDQDREFYVLPGGRVEPGETSAEAVRREVWRRRGCRSASANCAGSGSTCRSATKAIRTTRPASNSSSSTSTPTWSMRAPLHRRATPTGPSPQSCGTPPRRSANWLSCLLA